MITTERKIQTQKDYLISLSYEETQIKNNLGSLENSKIEITNLESYLKLQDEEVLQVLKEIELQYPEI